MIESFDIADILGCYVYIIRGHDDDVLYVGKSTNILYRIGQHLSNGQLSDPEKLCRVKKIEKIRCSSPSAMSRTEARLIEQHQPEWNINGMSSIVLELNASGIAVAAQWLTAYLQEHGPSQSAQVKLDAMQHGIHERAVIRAAKRIGVIVSSKSHPNQPHTTIWRLPRPQSMEGAG